MTYATANGFTSNTADKYYNSIFIELVFIQEVIYNKLQNVDKEV